MPDCVLFDLDGLLVDSEPLQFRAYQQAFADYDIELSMRDWVRWHSAEASTRRWIESEGLSVDVEELRDYKKGIYEQLIRTELALKPGAQALVESCAREARLAVVSASRRESIEACLDKHGLLDYFDTLVSGAEATRSKPYPDPYLAALRILDASPARAVAIEDSLTGYRAALAAGIRCVICPDHFIPKPDGCFDDADLVVDSLEALDIERLRELFREDTR